MSPSGLWVGTVRGSCQNSTGAGGDCWGGGGRGQFIDTQTAFVPETFSMSDDGATGKYPKQV